jgi:uncharacterized protein (TIGR03437 family)
MEIELGRGVVVHLNETRQSIQYAGQAPGFVGLDQINVPISKTLSGTYAVSLSVDGVWADSTAYINVSH